MRHETLLTFAILIAGAITAAGADRPLRDCGGFPLRSPMQFRYLCNQTIGMLTVGREINTATGPQWKTLASSKAEHSPTKAQLIRQGYDCVPAGGPSSSAVAVVAFEQDVRSKTPEIVEAWAIDVDAAKIRRVPISSVTCTDRDLDALGRVYDAGDEVRVPKLLSRGFCSVGSEYCLSFVMMEFIINADGTVRSARLLMASITRRREPHQVLVPDEARALIERACMAQYRQWKYAPPMRNGIPVAVHFVLTENIKCN